MEDGGEAEVGDAQAIDIGACKPVGADEDVLRLEIAVDEAFYLGCGMGHASGDLEDEEQRLLDRQGHARREPGAEGGVLSPLLLRHQFQHQVDFAPVADALYTVGTHDVRVTAQIDPGGALAQEAVAGGAVREELWLEGLEGDGAVLLVVEAKVDDAHTAHQGVAGDFVAARDAGSGWIELHSSVSLMSVLRFLGCFYPFTS